VVVNTSVAAGGTINAGWRVRLLPAGPKIIDIVVDGYSMTTHFNGQFQDWLSKAGLDGLVTKMRGQVRNSPSLIVVREIRGNG
jgi:ABC-type transporter MlaC component